MSPTVYEQLARLGSATVYEAGGRRGYVDADLIQVVPGSRAVGKGKGQEWGLSLYAPVIVKYRDEKSDLSTTLEDLLR